MVNAVDVILDPDQAASRPSARSSFIKTFYLFFLLAGQFGI